MYNYSPIKKLFIKNFRNLGEVEIDFTQSPIVTLLGENEAGKTSVVKAFATCALHSNPRDQKDYIRDGTKMFGVAIELEDGTSVIRMKEGTAVNAYQVKKNGQIVWSTNKITDGLPKEVQDIMGLIEEPETKEYLHVRTYEDKLLFVVTPNSTNYKVMYNALKVEQLTKAIKCGSVEANQYKSAINQNENSLMTLSNQLRGIQVYDMEPLINIREQLKSRVSILNRLENIKQKLERLEELKRQLGCLALINRFNLEAIDEVKALRLDTTSKKLDNLANLIEKRNEISEVDSLKEIDVNTISKVSSLISRIGMLDGKIKEARMYDQVSSCSEIYETLVLHLNNAKTLTDRVNTIKKSVSSIDVSGCEEISETKLSAIAKLVTIGNDIIKINNNTAALNDANSHITQLTDEFVKLGIAVETCPKCGETIVFDTDMLVQSS